MADISSVILPDSSQYNYKDAKAREDISDLIEMTGSGWGYIFSEDETVIGKWIDGKKIYQKTIDFGDMPVNDTKRVAHNISNIDKVIGSKTIVFSDNFYSRTPFTETNNNINDYITSTEVVMKTELSGDWSGLKVYTTIQYTKTTD